MRKTKKAVSLLLTLVLVLGITLVTGCSSSPSEEELMQLNNLKEEYAALQKEVASLSQEKEALEKEVAEKQAALKKCQDDQEVVKSRIK